ncbi:hypothetical protein GYMLUDRAFT_398115 [Collybiopsis luxurians FD-317 M1]|nr:hypothetical protein GYMLUDRAFT_398115 [Collybiopsis luxurians FD-317 M1]
MMLFFLLARACGLPFPPSHHSFLRRPFLDRERRRYILPAVSFTLHFVPLPPSLPCSYCPKPRLYFFERNYTCMDVPYDNVSLKAEKSYEKNLKDQSIIGSCIEKFCLVRC